MKIITLFAILVVLMMGVVYGVMFATGEERADMDGKIIGICHADPNDENNTQDSILVEGIVAGNSQICNVSVKINNDTVILRKNGNKRENASLDDMKTGTEVAVMFTGPFLESYPPQTTGKEIVIIP
ncbi:DUF3221 domain-containing protein [Methanobacterium petrolearium]|uniref:DUF3221 domain-containing protein n=1 Tax=Methanobacterium petrolearium TaxID=710190 RepID=UPI001AEA46EF|nr:DUF3221 domain-containing protein [Methanobacterium petrolearium]MBP1946511.1 type II secretory pathway component PulC [Methanobacterium petrolearium]BDZ69852.1 hypothetical protein GCM10025861_03690 [Methanobacterium petrolearium]